LVKRLHGKKTRGMSLFCTSIILLFLSRCIGMRLLVVISTIDQSQICSDILINLVGQTSSLTPTNSTGNKRPSADASPSVLLTALENAIFMDPTLAPINSQMCLSLQIVGDILQAQRSLLKEALPSPARIITCRNEAWRGNDLLVNREGCKHSKMAGQMRGQRCMKKETAAMTFRNCSARLGRETQEPRRGLPGTWGETGVMAGVASTKLAVARTKIIKPKRNRLVGRKAQSGSQI